MNYIKVVDDIFNSYKGQRFSVKLWDGKIKKFGVGKKSAFTLIIENESTFERLLAEGSIGFGESYMAGELKIDGDIEAYIRFRHQFKTVKKTFGLSLARLNAYRKKGRNRKEQVSYHYDLGNDFFKLFLDNKTLTYSAGKYKSNGESLYQAQKNKYDLIIDSLDLPFNSDVLDLGCGWGGFATYAARNSRWNVTGFTLSNKQLAYSKNLINKSKLESFVSFNERDMTIPLPRKKYDGIVVIEAIEHVGQESLSAFFKELSKALKPGAPLFIQTTGRYQFRRVDKWTLKYVFPGGYLPTKDELVKHATAAGFTMENFRDNTQDYIYTISEWIRNLEKNQEKIEKIFDESFYKKWYLWMHGAKVNFEIGDMSLFRILLRKYK